MLTFTQAIQDLGPVLKDGGGNPNHDEKGRFAPGEGSGRTGSANPNYDSQAAKLTEGLSLSRVDFERQPATEMELSSLVSAQPEINSERVSRMKENYDADLAGEIYIVSVGGKNIVWEGNHRVEATKQLGHRTIKARVITVQPTNKRKGKFMDFRSAIAKGNPYRADAGRYSTARASAMHAHPEGTLVRHKETGRQHLVQGHTDDGKVTTTGGEYGKDELEGALLAKGNPNHDEKGQFASGDGGGSGGEDKTVAGYSSQLASSSSDNDKFDALAAQLKGDKNIKQAEMREIAMNYIGYHISPSKSRTDSWQKIVDTQAFNARQTARISAIKSQPGASDVHATTALGNGKRKAKDFKSTIAETKGKVPDEDGVEKSDEPIDRPATLRLTKIDDEQMAVFGWASVTHINGEVVIDKQGDIIESHELEKAVYDYVRHCREQGDMHEKRDVGRLIASQVYTEEMAVKCGTFAFDPETGDQLYGWFVGFKVSSPDVWKRIKGGHLPEFSIGGRAIRVPAEIQ